MRPLATAIINLIVSIIAAHYIGLHGVLLGTVISRLSTQVWYDSKLIFNLVFLSSVKGYYLRYALYSCVSVIYCVIGYVLVDQVSGALVKFIIGFAYATFGTSLINTILFRKSHSFFNIKNYMNITLKRG